MYLVDATEFASTVSLRTTEPEQVQADTRFAEEYLLERVWPLDGTAAPSSNSAIGATLATFERADIPIGVVTDSSTPYDLLVEAGDGFLRTAVRTGHVSRGCLRLKPEHKQGIDAFVIYHRAEDHCYAVGSSEFDGSISLRVREPEKPDPTIVWADEYELPGSWPR